MTLSTKLVILLVFIILCVFVVGVLVGAKIGIWASQEIGLEDRRYDH